MFSSIKKFIRANTTVFISVWLIFLLGIMFLTDQYDLEVDITENQNSSLSPASKKLAQSIESPVSITAFVSKENVEIRSYIFLLVKKYQEYSPHIKLKFIDPTVEPSLVRELNIAHEGEVIVEHSNRSTHIQQLNEANLSNTLQSLLANNSRQVRFLTGHGERSINDGKGSDYSILANYLREKGIKISSANLIENKLSPSDTSLLVIADSRKELIESEIQQIFNYLAAGGNLLLLTEPGDMATSELLLEHLAIESFNGNIVDPNTQMIGIADPRFVVIPEYSAHPITQNLNLITIFPTSRAMEIIGSEDWEADILIETLPRTWLEFSELSEEVSLDSGQDIPGPLVIGIVLTRANNEPQEEIDQDIVLDDTQTAADTLDEMENEPAEPDSQTSSAAEKGNHQRVAVMGDADFMSNEYIGHGGNLELSMRIVNWLTSEDKLVDIPPRIHKDKLINLSQTAYNIIGIIFAILIPLVFALSGYIITRHRKNR